jgi:predicted ATPase/signal transduction histidine kinase
VVKLSSDTFELLRKDEEFALYRSRGTSDLPAALMVAPVAEHPGPESLKRLEHEYALRAQLEPEWAARPIVLVHGTDRTMLLLEDGGGTPLDRLLGQSFELAQFLHLALGLAAALGQLHRRGLIHKDLKPGHLLVDAASGHAWLTGFGLASPLPRERPAANPPELIVGTLAYMAPEQTGRMNRSIDSRADLYALGVTFYQLLTGTLPFSATDPMGWVHCHIARRPVPPVERRPAIPGPVSAVVMKLLAKMPEDRYQTAAGLEADLRHCLTDWQARGRIEEFPLGAHDVPDRLLMPEKLYGREAERQALLAAFERVVAGGPPELVLVAGYSGVGKSALVNELQRALVGPRGLFISGKFDQHQRNVPYATLAQAFQGLLRQLLSEHEAQVGPWREAIRAALGPNGQLMVNLIPELELLIGPQPPVPELPVPDAQHRFEAVLRRFVGAFARPAHPLALFLDDLQWLDPASLQLLESLLTHPDELGPLLLIGAYRTNEVGAAHPLARTLKALRARGAPVQELVLEPLSLEQVTQLVAEALRAEPGRVRPLAALVHEKTGGNPFFALQFLSALADEELLAFDAQAAAWRWELEGIRAQGFSDNVAELMAGKLQRLPAATQQALKDLACLGNRVELSTLALLGGSEEGVHTRLWEAVRAGLVFRQEGAYRFLHDRVQEAAYGLIPEALRPEVHLRLGRRLLARLSPDQLAEKLFEVANQLNRGAALITEPEEQAQAAELNLQAGCRAKAAAAYASACAYVTAGLELLGAAGWARRPGLMFALGLERAECEYLNGNFEEAEGLLAELLSRAASKVDLAAVYRLKIDLHIVRAEYRQAVDSGRECLGRFGLELPAQPTRTEVQAEYEQVWQNLGARSIESLLELPSMRDSEMQAALRLLSVLAAPAFFCDGNLFYLLVCRMANITLQHGTTDASAHGYTGLAVMLGPAFHRYGEGHRFGKLACSLVEKYGCLAAKAKAYLFMEMAVLWTQPLGTAIDLVRLALRVSIETSDLCYACYCCNHLVTDLLLQGVHLDEVWAESQKGLAFDCKARYRDAADIIISQQRFIQCLRGQTTTLASFSDAQFDEAAFEAQLTPERMPSMVCWYWVLKLQARFLAGDYAAAGAATQKAQALYWSLEPFIQSVDYHYYGALTLAARHDAAEGEAAAPPAEELAALKHSLERLAEWAEHCPTTFWAKHALVAAELARLEGRDLAAMEGYEAAIRAAREQGFAHDEALGNELTARFYLARGLDTVAQAYLRQARAAYLRWGALGKVRQLEEVYPRLREKAPLPGPTGTIGTPVEQLDLAMVMKAAQAVAGELDLQKLIQTLLTIALEHAGADRGLMLLPQGPELSIAAEARTGPEGLEVQLRPRPVTAAELPESLLRYVRRSQTSVILEDAAAGQHPFWPEAYLQQQRPRSVLGLPLVKQGRLRGVLYLENNLAPGVFTPQRLALLELVAAQAAIALEHAQLYADLARLNADLTQENRERQKAEDTLHKAQAELAHVMRLTTMGELAASIAHEVNQPLGAIVNNAHACLRLVAAIPSLGNQADEALSDIINDANRASAIIARVRALVKKTDLEKAPLDLGEVLADVLALARRELIERRIRVVTKLAQGLPQVWGDRVQLQQVFLNLVINALEAMSTVAEERRVLMLETQRDQLDGEPVVLVRVQDLGVGFGPGQFERLFEAFYTTKAQGLGMGLRISRSIVEAHGGRLWASANTGWGATFLCAFPTDGHSEP